MGCEWSNKIFSVSDNGFEPLALEVFMFQYRNNPVYRLYVNALGINAEIVNAVEKIPFLPVSFFKTRKIKTGDFEAEAVFESSGTTGSDKSGHYVKVLSLYEKSFVKGFEMFYGPVHEWCIMALLPSHLERKNSSLVYMAEKLIQLSRHPQSDFYLCEYERLSAVLAEMENKKQRILLLGVTFALLDFAENRSLPLRHTVVMETGGMKGRREEITRKEVHVILKKAFGKNEIHSEYGMTELFSQAYSKGDGIFQCPPWMKVLVRDEEDPLAVKFAGTGAINIIDLANVYSCSFIATDDVGKLNDDGSFEVLGRMDGSDLRGCSLMVV